MAEIIENLPANKRKIVGTLKAHSEELLDITPRFKYFTLHGKKHIDGIFKILDLLIENTGLNLSHDEAFLLSCSVCTHDLGMVIPLSKLELQEMFQGSRQPSDPTPLEPYIRRTHNHLVSKYIDEHFDFLSSIGLNPTQCVLISEISKGHRQLDLTRSDGFLKTLGALLRIADELDIGPDRAPQRILLDHFEEMDTTSCWHWFKHNITENWMLGQNVHFDGNDASFFICVHPPTENSIDYWLNQVRRPIYKVLIDEQCSNIVSKKWGVSIKAKPWRPLSIPGINNDKWSKIENKALSGLRKTILVIDDEVRKMEDLFLPLMQDYHVMFAPTVQDAIQKLNAIQIDLAIVDLQMGSSSFWTPEETKNFKMTGVRICKEIAEKYRNTKIGIFTGSRYDLEVVEKIEDIEFLLKKPIDPDVFEMEIKNVLS